MSVSFSSFDIDTSDPFQFVWEDGERAFYRGWRLSADGMRESVLVVRPVDAHPSQAVVDRLAHEYALANELDEAAAVRPLLLVREHGLVALVLEDPGGEPLERLASPIDTENFLRLAIAIVAALGKLHARGLVHKDIKQAHIVVNCAAGAARLTGFGIATQIPRERQTPRRPEFIEGTLAYMAPEQTGRMNRSVDSRSDLYALGVTYYRMLTGVLPFSASDPMEWVHCHIARQPVPPAQRERSVPGPVSTIVMKLLEKSAEDRYQTAFGVEHDLRCCLAQWETGGRIDDFPLGARDTPDRLLIPEKLYGRTRELDTLLRAFDRVSGGGNVELVLVTGQSGIGKSALVHELHKELGPSRGHFAAGKCDQYKRDVPHATLAQALQSLLRPLLGSREADLSRWRATLDAALDPGGALIVNLVPALATVVGEQPPVPELPPEDAQRRFQLVFRRFISVFATPEHPLVLFLDDLQWLDAATLDLLEFLLTRSDLHHFLLIGSYRDNEVAATHPLTRKLAAIREAGVVVHEIKLEPLVPDVLGQLIADSLRCEPERAAPLARLLQGKTSGNPFFALQFLTVLADEGLLSFNHAKGQWSWELRQIYARGCTDNVVELMVGKLGRLPARTLKTLQLLACLGNIAEAATLAAVCETSERTVGANMWEAVRQQLVIRQEGAYRFTHDRILEAAYSLIPATSRADMHLRIGRLLAARLPPAQREESVFEIVSQFDRAKALIVTPEERHRVAQLNLLAGKHAMISAAYSSALNYLKTGAEFLTDDGWACQHQLAFSLAIHRAECEMLTGDLKSAESRLAILSTRAEDTVERAMVASQQADVYVMLGQSDRTVAVGLDFLRHEGVDWSPHPTAEQAREEYERIWSTLGDRTIEALIDIPVMSDLACLAVLDVLTKVFPAALFTDLNLYSLVICRAVNLGLERGICDASCAAYVRLGLIAGFQFGDYAAGFQFARLGYELVEQRAMKRFQARTYETFGLVAPWTNPVRTAREPQHRAFDVACAIGDYTYAAYSCAHLNTNLLLAGDPLVEVQRGAEHGLEFARSVRFGFAADLITPQLQLARTLRGSTRKFGSFDDDQFDERQFELNFSSKPALAAVACWYWIRKLQARFLAGDYAIALESSSMAQTVLTKHLGSLEIVEFYFFDALSRAAICEAGSPLQRRQHLDAMAIDHQKLQAWAENCPENFENRRALVAAEMARLQGADLEEVMRLYELAIRSARESGFVHNEALACERAARFYAARGFEAVARLHMRQARCGYLRWGADAKVQQLDELFPQLLEDESDARPAITIGAPAEYLDLTAVIKVSQAVFGEVVPERLIDTLLRHAIEYAGAGRGLLITPRDDDLRVEAEALAGCDRVVAQPGTGAALPESVVHYVARTRESVILGDASVQNLFSADPYITRFRPRSMLCLPLINGAKLVGVLYLENNLASHVFTSTRIAMLKLLASQAAISLENSRLYLDLAEREVKIRRLVEANIIGIFIWRLDGQIVEANDAFLRMVGYDRDDIVAGRVKRDGLSAPEWRERDLRTVIELKTAGIVQPFEKEYTRKDGQRVPILIGLAAFGEQSDQGVAFVLDLTERKRAETETREAEQRYREMQASLAHANRLATVGQLTASIAHEIKQPIAASAVNAQAAMRWLRAEPPKLKEAQQALDRVVADAMRAGDVLSRIRDLVTKTPQHKDLLRINEAIIEVVELIRGDLTKNEVEVELALADNLPLVRGDRVQLQQVMLNLILNAVEAMTGSRAGPRELLIGTAPDDSGGVRITVRDSGPGIASANIERIFEPFYTTKSGGMGMGLSICRSIVEVHRGRMWADASMAGGTVFQVVLPGHYAGDDAEDTFG
ncbi:AAA family ATPase [Paraburkholderia sp. BR10882]|uniref:AAA family ATPase n=1 Tax=unclassified Paraburkholderia TaxID=2615204 RepID=UPI0034CD7280